MTEIGTRIRQARLDRGMTLPELRFETGIFEEEIVALETGKAELSPDQVTLLAEALRVPERTFMTRDSEE